MYMCRPVYVVIAGGVKRTLLAIWFCGNRSMARGQARTFIDMLEADTSVPLNCLLSAVDDRVDWRKSMGGRLRSS